MGKRPRRAREWRPAALSRTAGLNRAEITRLENATTKDPRVSTVEALAEQLDVTGMDQENMAEGLGFEPRRRFHA